MKIKDAGLKFKSALFPRKETLYIVIHHADAIRASVEDVHSWHLQRGWTGIGYHFYVRKDGTVYQGRPMHVVGSHCPARNSDSVGICFEGNYANEQVMPDAQYEAGVNLIRYIQGMYGNKLTIGGHKQWRATTCPGTYFPLEEMIALKSRTKTPEVQEHWGVKPINTLFERKYISSIHQPLDIVSWGEVAKVVCEIKQITVLKNATDWAKPYVYALMDSKIISNYHESISKITWAELAKVVCGVMKIDVKMKADEYWGLTYLDALQDNKITSSTHNPDAQVTWAEFASILVKALAL